MREQLSRSLSPWRQQSAPRLPSDCKWDARAPTTPFPHFWEQTFGSGRAVLALRKSYLEDLRTVKQATGFQSIRFHGIFDDEVGLYDPDRQTKNPGLAAQAANDASVYNFSYVDQIYDGLLAEGVKPFVEMSFMPKKMASDPAAIHPFWYHPNVSPPKDYAAWDKMIHAFAAHLMERYGIAEVATWKFEVWNEPNLDFWGGSPQTVHLFSALRPYRSRLESRVAAPSGRRSGDRAGRMGCAVPRPREGGERAGGFRLHARLRQRYRAQCAGHRGRRAARQDGLSRGADGA